MEIKQRNRLIGAAAAAIVIGGAGVGLGRSMFAPDVSHEGETAEGHARELASASAGGDAEHSDGEEEHVEGEVDIDDAAVEASDIGLVTLAPGNFGAEIIGQATVVAAPDGVAVLTARASGAITDIRKRLGDPVERGETVAVVASAEAAAISAELATAKSQLELARSTFEREKRLFEARITARQEMEAAQAELGRAEAEFRRSETAARTANVTSNGASVLISSPIKGRITFAAETAQLGAYVAPDVVLYRIADPTRIQIQAAVPVSDAQRIRPGDPAVIRTARSDGVSAVVRSVTPGVDVESRSASVVLDMPDGLGDLQPGQFVRAHITPQSEAASATGFVLPEEAVQSVEGRDVVFVREGHKFTATPVRVGSRSGGQVEILAGVESGQVVAGRNAFLLKAELGKGEAEH